MNLTEWRDAVEQILIEECGSRHDKADFRHCFPGCVEYRFMGALGFGGKVYCQGHRLWVGCYREDDTPERLAMIAAANERLALLPRLSQIQDEV